MHVPITAIILVLIWWLSSSAMLSCRCFSTDAIRYKGTELSHSTSQQSPLRRSISARSSRRPRPSEASTPRSSSPPAAGPEAAAGCPVNREGLGLNEIRLIHRGPGGSGPGEGPAAAAPGCWGAARPLRGRGRGVVPSAGQGGAAGAGRGGSAERHRPGRGAPWAPGLSAGKSGRFGTTALAANGPGRGAERGRGGLGAGAPPLEPDGSRRRTGPRARPPPPGPQRPPSLGSAGPGSCCGQRRLCAPSEAPHGRQRCCSRTAALPPSPAVQPS